MKSLVFECKTIAPMLLSGADNTTPEFRIASLKGVLRFWWRVTQGHLDVGTLRQEEQRMFGGTQDGGLQSPLLLKLAPPFLTRDSWISYPPTPHKPRFEAQGFATNQSFGLSLRLRQISKKESASPVPTLELFENALFLTSWLGGIGKRTRRGFGAFSVTKMNQQVFDKAVDLDTVFTTLTQLNPNYRRTKNAIVHDFDAKLNAPFIRSIHLGSMHKDIDALLEKIGQATHDHQHKALGYARGQDRLASPVVVSILQQGNASSPAYCPIVTTLNWPETTRADLDHQQRFREAILQ